jgi:hypothetical protein
VDYDGTNECFYAPVDLDDRMVLARGGLDPSESDPRFHQQMVYAVASRTIEMFEVALGRDIHWRRADRRAGEDASDTWRKADDIQVLHLYPHAMREANAYYSPQAHGILFGYFKADQSRQGRNLPRQWVFTCLSHDIIAHEVTHAVIDGIRTYFTEPTNPDVLAFHEGFADLCALFAHFSHTEALVDAIQRTGGWLYQASFAPIAAPGADAGHSPVITAEMSQANPLIQLAQQFGQARGAEGGLRSALGTPPNSDDIRKRVDDPHFRGSILVAAVFDAFFSVYLEEIKDLLHLTRAAGTDPAVDLPRTVAEHLAIHASDTATHFFELCARAVDYCPPVDLTFGDFLRALITVSTELQPEDRSGVRPALMDAFRVRGIYADAAAFYSEDALAWPILEVETLPPVEGLIFGSPNGLTRAQKDINGCVLRDWAARHRGPLGLDPILPVSVPSFHPVFHRLQSGRLQAQMLAEIVQTRSPHFDPAVPAAGSFPFRGGVTLIIGAPELVSEQDGTLERPPEVRFAISKPITGDEGRRREDRQRASALSLGLALGDTGDPNHFQANFGLIHEGR